MILTKKEIACVFIIAIEILLIGFLIGILFEFNQQKDAIDYYRLPLKSQEGYEKGFIDGIQVGVILGAEFEECNLEEQVKGVISNPTEYCFDKFVNQRTLKETKEILEEIK